MSEQQPGITFPCSEPANYDIVDNLAHGTGDGDRGLLFGTGVVGDRPGNGFGSGDGYGFGNGRGDGCHFYYGLNDGDGRGHGERGYGDRHGDWQ